MDQKENQETPAPMPESNTGTEKRSTDPSMDEFMEHFEQEMRQIKPRQDAMGAALDAIQQINDEAAAESAASQNSTQLERSGKTCTACGNRNRETNKFCAMCGRRLPEERGMGKAMAEFQPTSAPAYENAPSGQHHYHHHYHHHFFQPSAESDYQESAMAARAERGVKEVTPVRAPLTAPAMSRAEAAVRKLTQDLALACNTKQLDDVLDLYSADALLMRANTPAVRGSAAIREFFFSALDSGLCEVEMETLRVEILGDVAYEAGRCKMLVPFAHGKRREERGKYLIIYHRRAGGEWKISADCWSSDLTLAAASEPETARTSAAPPRAGMPRKSA